MTPSDATPDPGIFARSRAAAAALGWSFRHVTSTGSTNVDLADGARAGERDPAVLTTDHQTAGRGRLDRRWEDDGRSQLMVSFRVPVAGTEAQWLAGAVAVAARRAVAAAGAPVGFKWPNDLVVESPTVTGKVAGVLAEYVPGPPDVVVVGMGLNLAPPGIAGAAALSEVGCELSRDELLAAMIDALPALIADPATVRIDLSDHSVTLGRRVRVTRAGDELVGTAVGIDPDGRLHLEVDDRDEVVAVGDVVHLRPADD